MSWCSTRPLQNLFRLNAKKLNLASNELIKANLTQNTASEVTVELQSNVVDHSRCIGNMLMSYFHLSSFLNVLSILLMEMLWSEVNNRMVISMCVFQMSQERCLFEEIHS